MGDVSQKTSAAMYRTNRVAEFFCFIEGIRVVIEIKKYNRFINTDL